MPNATLRVKASALAAAMLLLSSQLPLCGQEARSTILGRVLDPTSAVVVGARVEALNTNTGVRSIATTNATGDYMFPFLVPGLYTISAESPGFRRLIRSEITLRVNDRITIDIQMELGETSQSVEVVGMASLLDTSTASMGQVMDSRTLLDLPLRDGNVLIAATMSPGVLFSPESPGYVRPFDTSSPSSMSIDGSGSGSSEFSLDGSPNTQRTQVAYSPPPGIVEEFKIQGASFDASYGFKAGATVNLSLKSGTNQLHGQTYYFTQNPTLGANRFFYNRAGTPKLAFRLQRWGASASGPVMIPKLYDGRNKNFWMYGYEGIKSYDPMPGIETVPGAAQRLGDFSGLLALGSKYQIYDPYSIAPASGGLFSRQPLQGNIVPSSQISPTAAKIAQLWDLPNLPGTADGVNNYVGGRNSKDTYFNHIARVDHNLGDKQRFYVRANFTRNLRPQYNRHSGAMGWTLFRKNRGAAVDHVYTLTPTFIVNSRYSYTRFVEGYVPDSMGWDLAGMGFSDTFIRQIGQVDPRGLKLPRINASGYVQLSGTNSCCMQSRHTDTHDFAFNGTNIIQAHTLRFGVGYRVYRENLWNLSDSSGSLTFGTDWTRGPLNTSSSSPSSVGQGLASLLYGLPTGGSFPIVDNYAEQAPVWAFYIQDDWKVSTKLTLSVGLRYELPRPLTERFNRSVKGFDFAASSPIEAQAKANYAAKPIPEVPVDQFQAKGGLTFAGVGGASRPLYGPEYRSLMPRFGFAYSFTQETVVRGGYGIYFEPIGVVNIHVNQTGFSQSTSLTPSVDNGLHFIASVTNPFPDGFLQPMGAAGGLATNLGQSVSFFNQDVRNPYMQRWQLAVQRALPKQSVLEVSYVGNRAVRQRITRNLGTLPNSYLSTSPVRDQATINYLSAAVPNPFYPLLPGTSLSSTTVSRSQLLAPYPHFTAVNLQENQGYSWYHSMQARVEKRFSAGFSSTLAYTWSKTMGATSFLNSGDAMPERVVDSQDRTHRLTVTWIHELPFGRGRRWGATVTPAMSILIGGWQVQGIYTAQSGAPLGFGNMIFNGNLKDIPLPESQKTIERWFNIDAGFELLSAKQLSSNVRTAPSRFNGIRADGVNNWDLSVIKNTRIKEGIQLQFRAESMNALNHPQFTSPNTTPSSSAFGQVTSEWSPPRSIQLALKVLF